MNNNTYKTLCSYRKKRKILGPFFIHFIHKKILKQIVLDKNNIDYIKKINPDFNIKNLKSYIKNYCLNKNFNFYLTHKSLINAVKVDINPKFVKGEINACHFFIFLFIHKFKAVLKFLECNILVIIIIFKTLSRKSDLNFKNNIIYFHDLRPYNTISSELLSFLDFCILDKDINPSNNKDIFSANFMNDKVQKKNLIKGDFLTKTNLFLFIRNVVKLNLMFICSFLNDSSNINILFKELFKKIIVDSSLKNIVRFNIIFDNSNMGFTPFWATGNQRENFLIFYSTNFGYNLDKTSKELLFPLEYENMNWRNIYVWDEIQKDILFKYNRDTRFKIIRKINFTDNGEKIKFKKTYFNIVIFDITPKNLLTLASGLNLGDNFYTNNYMNSFINNILSFNKKNVRFFIKHKRKIDGVCKGYKKNMEVLKEHKKVVFLNENITPERIIKHSDLVVAPVYSTPALIAKHLKIPSIYFDPSGVVDKKYIYNRNIPIISNKNIKSNLNKFYQSWQK